MPASSVIRLQPIPARHPATAAMGAVDPGVGLVAVALLEPCLVVFAHRRQHQHRLVALIVALMCIPFGACSDPRCGQVAAQPRDLPPRLID